MVVDLRGCGNHGNPVQKRSGSMKRILSVSGKLGWAKRVPAALAMSSMTAIGVPGQIFTPLHAFQGTDGSVPVAGLVQATNGDLYGTTAAGGTAFKMTPTGTLTNVYTFQGPSDPNAGLVQATNGYLYGTTVVGGVNDLGTVFKMTPSGTLTTLPLCFDWPCCAQTSLGPPEKNRSNSAQ